MGQSQSDSNDSRIRRVQTNPLSADILSAGGSTDGRRFSTRPQLTPSSETTVRSFSLTRRRKAVQKRLSSIVKPKLELEATSSRARVNEGSQLARTDIPEASGHRSAWRRSLRFVKSRRWNKVSDHNKDDGGERISISNSDATLPISISPPQSSSSNSTVSIPACSSDSATTSQPPETSVPNPDTAILGSADIPTILTPALSVPPFSGEESNTNPLAIPTESIAALSSPQAAGEMETTDQIAVATAENPIVVASNANSGAISENVTVLLEPNSTSTATTTVPVSPARPQFPPSGTLVVVQGVVHTSDVQMSTETSAPFLSQTQNHNPNPTPPSSVIAEAPQTTDDFRTVQRVPSSVSSGHRGRLSALLRRTHRSPSSSRARSVSSALDSSSTHSANEASADIRQSQTSDAADVQSSTLYTPSPSPPVIQRGNPSGTISSSSIDVLGTLLSVAAAATAASLLTGSSDSASSTGLAYPSLVTTGTPSSTSIPGANTPALGVPSSLEFSSPYPSTSRRPLSTQINTTNTESVGARDRAERISQLWSAVRSRLGIGHGQPSSQRTDPDSQPFTNPIDSDASADAAAVDARGGPGVGPVMDAHNARERMLNEISRAFNLGFSSPSSSAPPANFTTDVGDTSQGPTIGRAERGNSDSGLPSEGTFERFLLDLQVDLRNVLTGEGDRRTTREREEPAIPEANSSVTSQDERLPRPLREPEPEDDTEEDSIPSLQDVSDSDDDTESNNSQASSSDSFASVSPADEAAQHRFNVSESPNDPSIPRPRINYWRLHRFPPIPAARAHAAADNVAQNMRSGLGGLTRAATLASTPAPRSVTSIAGEDSGTEATPSLSRNSVVQDSPNTGSANVVVPVIIVGLQSVSPFWATEPITTPRNLMNQSPVPSRADNAIRSTPIPTTGTMLQDTGSSASSSTSPVGMTSQGTQTQTSNTTPRDIGIPIPSPDSRTFLIYVIGGYYPPDHEIVTGTGENGVLDSSFEALLLLNELLHRAPFETPITVTKEQLNKSGLEIINGGQMQEWVKAGKVRSNCVEQCLICLEEYDKQDSVRVLECKHAFHMDCVDRWLLEGRNSCPACRGKGVSEGSEARSS